MCWLWNDAYTHQGKDWLLRALIQKPEPALGPLWGDQVAPEGTWLT